MYWKLSLVGIFAGCGLLLNRGSGRLQFSYGGPRGAFAVTLPVLSFLMQGLF